MCFCLKKNLVEVAARALVIAVRTGGVAERMGVVEKSNCVVAARTCVIPALAGMATAFEKLRLEWTPSEQECFIM